MGSARVHHASGKSAVFTPTQKGYKDVRNLDTGKLTLLQRAARSLYLNRTRFKGMWRHNMEGKFNIGQGGRSRRWTIRRRDLFEISSLLQRASLECSDFEPIISSAKTTDYLFLDPPYRPDELGQRAASSSLISTHSRPLSTRTASSLGRLPGAALAALWNICVR